MYRLREIERDDIIEINRWRNDPEIISYLGAPFRYINREVDEKWFDGYMTSRNNSVRCVITDETNSCLGLVSLTNINYLNRTAEFHIQIGDNTHYGKGMGTFAVMEMLNHAFNNLNLHRVELGVLADNYRAIHLYEKCGFMKEGCKHSAIYKNGEYKDLLMYAILRENSIESGGVNSFVYMLSPLHEVAA